MTSEQKVIEDELATRPDRRPSRLERQAAALINADTTAVKLVSQLDIEQYATGDAYPDWHPSRPFAPMVRACLLKELEDTAMAAVHRRLNTDPTVARALGFNPTDIPARSTFSRAWTTRFAAVQSRIERDADRIRTLAAECGSPIGGTAFQPEETSDTSECTIQRLLRGKATDVLEEMEWTVFPAYAFDRPENAVYADEELLQLETLMGIEQEAANNGGQLYGDEVNPNPALDDPFYADGPTGETLLDAIKSLTVNKIAAMHNRAAARLLTRAKTHLEFSLPVQLTIDMTYVGYYGDREGMVWLQGAPDNKEYDWCHKFATAAIVGDHTHFTVAMLPVGNVAARDAAAYPGADRSYRVGEVVRELLAIATEHVRIDTVYADREFYAVDTIAACEQYDVFYVIPAARTVRIKRFLTRMDDRVTVTEAYPMHGPVKHCVTNQRVVTTLIGLPPDDHEDDDDKASPQAFITNLAVDDEISLDRRQTRRKIERYRRRGGIETSYKIKEFAAWTTSKAFEVRWFHFGFAVLLYNMSEVRQVDCSCMTGPEIYIGNLNFASGYA